MYGIQIENPHKEGDFLPAHPLKDAIVMNVGDLLQRWTNGKLAYPSLRPPVLLFQSIAINLIPVRLSFQIL